MQVPPSKYKARHIGELKEVGHLIRIVDDSVWKNIDIQAKAINPNFTASQIFPDPEDFKHTAMTLGFLLNNTKEFRWHQDTKDWHLDVGEKLLFSPDTCGVYENEEKFLGGFPVNYFTRW